MGNESGPHLEAERVGPATMYLRDPLRYRQAPAGAENYPIPQEPVTRETYLDWIDQSGLVDSGEPPAQMGRYYWHAMPYLAKYAQTGERRWGEICLRFLHWFEEQMRAEVAERGFHEFFMFAPMNIALLREHLVAGGLLDPEEPWFREMILYMNRTVRVWGGTQVYWRGPMHRALGEGTMKAMAARWYPDAPEAAEWRDYWEKLYPDFWEFKDIPPNDTGYYYGVLNPLVLYQHLTGDEEFFTHPEMQIMWERMAYEITPDGSINPWGAHGGWNSTAGYRVFMLELAGTHTRDGRYRAAAHRVMNYLRYQQEPYRTHGFLNSMESTFELALAYLLADDSVAPVALDGASRVLYRKETLRLRDSAAAPRFLRNMAVTGEQNRVDCEMLVTHQVKPHKLILTSGPHAGALHALVDLFPRHDPLNPTGIVGLTQWGAPMTCTFTAKGASDENRLMVQDLQGGADTRHNPDRDLNGGDFVPGHSPSMETEVPDLHELPRAVFARVTVSDYMGYPVRQTREFVLVKDRFLVARDLPVFEEGFACRVGPVWNTQNVGPQLGAHWANTFVSMPLWVTGGEQPMHAPPLDLLVYYTPQPGCRLQIVDRTALDPRAEPMPAQVRYVWEGEAQAGQELLFTQVYYPHAPSKAEVQSNMMQAQAEYAGGELAATAGASGIEALLDTRATTVLRLCLEEGREEWVVLNPGGTAISAGELETDARWAYVDVREGEVAAVDAVEGTRLSLRGREVLG